MKLPSRTFASASWVVVGLWSGCADVPPTGGGATATQDVPGVTTHFDGGPKPDSASAPGLGDPGLDSGMGPRDAGGSTGGHAGPTRDGAPEATTGEIDAAMVDAGADAMVDAADGGDAGSAPVVEGFVGNITTRGQVRDDFARYWDQITPENEGKWGSVEPVRDQMNWAGIDRAYEYAKAHDLPFKQHTFVWGSQQPAWIGTLSQQAQRQEVEEWIRLFCERYPDVQLIDVVNEPPPHTKPVYAEALGGDGSSGYDWIVQSFEWARTYCPDAILILNDYNNIEYGNDNRNFIDIVDRIVAAGAPVDALGAQAHDAYKLPNDVVKGFLDNLAATGLPLYISEYDINLGSDEQQQQVMEKQFPMFQDHPSVKGITLWGYVSGATWLPDTGLMSNDGTPRPALSWLMDHLGR